MTELLNYVTQKQYFLNALPLIILSLYIEKHLQYERFQKQWKSKLWRQNIRWETEEWKKRKEMKVSFSITLYFNSHPPCHCFSKFLLPPFSSSITPNLNVAVTLRFFFIPLRKWEVGVRCQIIYEGQHLNRVW